VTVGVRTPGSRAPLVDPQGRRIHYLRISLMEEESFETMVQIGG
jgi:hypothetical protein